MLHATETRMIPSSRGSDRGLFAIISAKIAGVLTAGILISLFSLINLRSGKLNTVASNSTIEARSQNNFPTEALF